MSKKIQKKTVAAEVKDLTAQRNEVCIPIAREILKRIGNQPDLKVGIFQAGDQSVEDYYANIYLKEVLPLLNNDKVSLAYVDFIFQLVQQALTKVQNVTIETLTWSKNRMLQEMFEVADMDDITVAKIDSALRMLQQKKGVDKSSSTK